MSFAMVRLKKSKIQCNQVDTREYKIMTLFNFLGFARLSWSFRFFWGRFYSGAVRGSRSCFGLTLSEFHISFNRNPSWFAISIVRTSDFLTPVFLGPSRSISGLLSSCTLLPVPFSFPLLVSYDWSCLRWFFLGQGKWIQVGLGV